MQVIGLIWGILAVCGLFVASIPFLGWLNWANIPFAIVGLIISTLGCALAKGNKAVGTGGIILCLIAIIFGALRLKTCGGFI